MQTWEDEQLAQLRARFPDWDIWTVLCYLALTVWCARPTGHPVATINTDSPEHLVQEIRRQEQDRLQRPR